MNDELIFQLGHKHYQKCPIHQADVTLREGKFGPYYHCVVPGCDVSGSAHGDGRPMGDLIVESNGRVFVHQLFEQLKKKRILSGNEIYREWLPNLFQTTHIIHISDMNDEQLQIVTREVMRLLYPTARISNLKTHKKERTR